MPTSPSLGERLTRGWARLSPLPGGSRLFSRLLWRMVPYSGTVRPHILELRPGHARVELRERRSLRNHLRSVHAIALANLGELASGLALTTALPPGVRGIPVALSIEYLKKARGVLVAEGTGEPPPVPEDGEVEAHARADIRDASGEVVARTLVRWRLGPTPE